MNEKKKHPDGFSRRGLLKTAGIVGAGLAAGSQILKPGMAIGVPSQTDFLKPYLEPGNPVVTEILYDPDTGTIFAARFNDSGESRLRTDPEVKSASTFELFDHAEFLQESRQNGIRIGGTQGKFRIRNGKLDRNPLAERTLNPNAHPFKL